jgi:Patatin-like phospholipase
VLEAELLRLRPGAPCIDPDLDEVGRCEQVRIQVASLATPLAALCLSGGGIRSAAFGLGIIQGLARANLLAEFDYLSTVSGGGYIGLADGVDPSGKRRHPPGASCPAQFG